MDELQYITETLIEASGALRIVNASDNSVNRIIDRLDRAICKAKRLAPCVPSYEKRSEIREIQEIQETVGQPSATDLSQADQTPRFGVASCC